MWRWSGWRSAWFCLCPCHESIKYARDCFSAHVSFPPSSHHSILVFAQNWKGANALDLLFFYQLEKYLTVSYLNVAFHPVPAFVGEGVWVISSWVTYCPKERVTEPQYLECQWSRKFLAGLPLVLTMRFGPTKDIHLGCKWEEFCWPRKGPLQVQGGVLYPWILNSFHMPIWC